MGIRVSPSNAVALGGDLLGTGSTVAAPRVGSITGSAGVVSVRSGSVLSFDGGASVASTTGQIRMPNNVTMLAFRNAANSADLVAIASNAGNDLTVGANGLNNLILNAGTGSNLLLQTSAVTRVNVSAGQVIYSVPINLQGTNAAQSGNVRAVNNTTILAVRNAANSADIAVIATDATDHLLLSAGTSNTTSIRLKWNTQTLVEMGAIAANQRYVAINRANNITTTELPANSGDLVLYVGDAATAPTASSVSGGLLYSEAGAGKWRGTGGTVTTFGAAEPHCPRCDRDYVFEARNDVRGEHLAICWACFADEAEDKGLDVSRFAFHRVLRKVA